MSIDRHTDTLNHFIPDLCKVGGGILREYTSVEFIKFYEYPFLQKAEKKRLRLAYVLEKRKLGRRDEKLRKRERLKEEREKDQGKTTCLNSSYGT